MNKEKLLLVIDYQIDFVNGSLGFDGAEKLEPFIVSKINEYKNNNDDIIFTLDTHYSSYLDTIEGKKLPILHCIDNTNGHRLYGRVEELSKDYPIIKKNTFGSKELINVLKDRSYKEVEIVGLVSSICVFSNAVIAKAALPNSRIVVLRKGTSSYDLEMQEKSFDVLKNLHIEVE